MISDTASTASSRHTVPISPCFSNDSTSGPASEATSDEEPDLGAFNAVLRAWNHLQPYPRIPIGFPSSSSSTGTPPFDSNSSISSFTHPGFSSATISATDEAEELNAEEPWEDQLLGDYLESSAARSLPEDQHSSDESERTVEISSDIDTVSMDESVVHREDPSEMAVPVFSPNIESRSVLEEVSMSSQNTLRRHPGFPPYAYPYRSNVQHDPEAAVRSLLEEAARNRSVVNDVSSIATHDDQHDRASLLSSSPPSIQTQAYPASSIAIARSPPMVIEPPSPLPTPTAPSETFPYEETEYDIRTPTRGGFTPRHSYPHPLVGLHVLPSSLHTMSEVPDDNDSTRYDPTESSFDHTADEEDEEQQGEHPTLGLLDEALSFIASERARFEAAKKPSSTTFSPGTSPDTSTNNESSTWAVVEPAPPAKRKRRRKKTSGATATASTNEDTEKTDDNASSIVASTTRPLLLAPAPSQGTISNKLPKAITILARPKGEPTSAVADVSVTSSAMDHPDGLDSTSFSLTGKKGKRVGRREREREKARRDAERVAAGLEPSTAGLDTDEEGEDDEHHEDDTTNKSAPTASQGEQSTVDSDRGPPVGEPPEVKSTPTKKKKARKRQRGLTHAKSFPNFQVTDGVDLATMAQMQMPPFVPKKRSFEYEDVDDVEDGRLSQNKRTRLVVLANKLLNAFPEQKKELKKVIKRLEMSDGTTTSGTDKAVAVSSMTPMKKGKGHTRGASGSMPITGHSYSNPDMAQEDDAQDPAELDVLGAQPTQSSSLIHIFIDHSNILIGLLNFLKRHPPPQAIVDEYVASTTRPPYPAPPVTTTSINTTAKAHPIAIPTRLSRGDMPIIESPVVGNDYPIPLPSFANAAPPKSTSMAALSKSLPNRASVLDANMADRRDKRFQGVVSDGDGDEEGTSSGADGSGLSDGRRGEKSIKFPRRLWHAALALVLERGRAVSRRVVVTSSPLYQPMEKIQNLGYEVRIYIRVPDLGDGMDRRDKDAKGKSNAGGKAGAAGLASSPAKHALYGGGMSSTTATSSSSANAISAHSSGSGAKGHARHLSGSMSADSSGAGPNFNASATTGKIRYREQGVDELLQLKLHQALADVDKVPKGSTIVLATGDGNVGQFNEDGFLGPVRTALKRGWKVELYAWEDGLSKAWRREFGENSEWGQKGLFRIIPLEPFATNLVEAAGW